MVYAPRDPIGANPDRIQIVKGWMTADGEAHSAEVGPDGKRSKKRQTTLKGNILAA